MKQLGRQGFVEAMKLKNFWLSASAESRLRQVSFDHGIPQSDILREGAEWAIRKYERDSANQPTESIK